MVHNQAAGDLLAAELRQALADRPDILGAFSGRILPDGGGYCRPHLVVSGRPDGSVRLEAWIRGTPEEAKSRLGVALDLVQARPDVTLCVVEQFRAREEKRESFAVAIVRQRRSAPAAAAA